MLESVSGEVKLWDTNPSAIELLLEFIYTGSVTVDSTNAVCLLEASNQYQMEPVKDMCERFLMKQVDLTNCLSIFSMADFMDCQQLKEVAEDFILLHFTDLYKQEGFLQLHLKQVVHLLHQDKLVTKSEDQIYAAAVHWVNHDLRHREQHLTQVLGCVRFALVSKTFFSDRSCSEHDQCLMLPINGTFYHMTHKHLQDKRPRRHRPIVAVFGGRQTLDTYYFNPKDGTWAEFQSSSMKSWDEAAVSCDHTVYIIGGTKSYSVLEDVWQLQPAPNMDQVLASACACEGNIYRSGGIIGKLSVTVFDCYDTKSRLWKTQRSMLSARDSHGSVEVNGLIYVCGGATRNTVETIVLNNCEVYNPRTGQWSEICRMNKGRMNHGLVVVSNKIYALGGQGPKGALRSVEVYDVAGDAWTFASPMPWTGVRVNHVKCAAVGRIIYVVAGSASESGERLQRVLEYHTHSDRWVICEKTQAFPFPSCLVCVIYVPYKRKVVKRAQCFKTFKVKGSK